MALFGRDDNAGSAVAQKHTPRSSLIIAIEPDRHQAAQLKDLVRRHTGAELILADTTAGAIGAMESRVPDLVLIPAFLSPEDDQALTAALRVTEEAAHVQTLTIPMLGEPQQKSTPQSVLARLRWDQPRPSSPDSCDPKLFAEQITEYLERVAKERGPVAGGNGHGSHGSNGTGRRPDALAGADKAKTAPAPKAAAPTPRPAPRPEAVVTAAPEPQAEFPPESEPAVAMADLEAALAGALDVQAAAEGLAPEELAGLEEGLSSLLERLSAEEPVVTEHTAATTPAPRAAKVDASEWASLKNLESAEYAMPAIAPRDEDNGAPAVQTEPATVPAAPAVQSDEKKAATEWGDLMESLKKDLGR